jgi:hypothetical protein
MNFEPLSALVGVATDITPAVEAGVSITAIWAAGLTFMGVVVSTGGLIIVSLIKMRRANTSDHGEVRTGMKILSNGQEILALGQRQLTDVVVQHIDSHKEGNGS